MSSLLTRRAALVPRLLRNRRYLSSETAPAYLSAHADGITSLSLNRPAARNAISVSMLENLHSCLSSLDSSTRVLLVRSSDPSTAFCAGADLAERRTMSAPQVSAFLSSLRQFLSTLESLPIPTIACIDGPALGGGIEMALACDLRVANKGVTKIGFPETALGIIPGAGGTQRAARLIGLSRAKDLIFTARQITASDALDIGLVDYVTEEESSVKAMELAGLMARNAPLALQAAKQAIGRSIDVGLETGLDFERVAYQTLIGSQDRVEALNAFREKRKPVFKGI